jgi:DNA-binding transcriptional ArsR family regulator
MDRAFGALSDPTRRGILRRLGAANASITELAEKFQMTLTGMKKHVQVLEDAGLVKTEKVGRVRVCRLSSHRLAAEADWIRTYGEMVDARLERLGNFLERTKGEAL